MSNHIDANRTVRGMIASRWFCICLSLVFGAAGCSCPNYTTAEGPASHLEHPIEEYEKALPKWFHKRISVKWDQQEPENCIKDLAQKLVTDYLYEAGKAIPPPVSLHAVDMKGGNAVRWFSVITGLHWTISDSGQLVVGSVELVDSKAKENPKMTAALKQYHAAIDEKVERHRRKVEAEVKALFQQRKATLEVKEISLRDLNSVMPFDQINIIVSLTIPDDVTFSLSVKDMSYHDILTLIAEKTGTRFRYGAEAVMFE